MTLIFLYWDKLDNAAINNLLCEDFETDKEKILQLRLLSAQSFGDAPAKYYLKSILKNRSIAFQVDEEDYQCYEMLLDHLPENYCFYTRRNGKNKYVISILENS